MSCSVVNCKNRASGSFSKRCFRFPSDKERRKRWIINCGRGSWVPGPGARICEVHFEDSQFEANRVDGWKKLKPTAVPTLFDVPNLPQRIESIHNHRKALNASTASCDMVRENSVEADVPDFIIPCDIEEELSNHSTTELDPCDISILRNASEELSNVISTELDPCGVNILCNISEELESYANLIKRQASLISCFQQINKECFSALKYSQERYNDLLEHYLKSIECIHKLQEARQ